MKKTLLPTLAFMGFGLMQPSASTFAETLFPYIFDLSESNEGWMSFNYNNDGESWLFFEGMGTGMASQMYDADDAFISPAITLEKGKQYKIAARVQLFNDVADTYHLAFTVGRNLDKDGQKVLKQFNFKQQGVNTDSIVYTAEESGDYYFGFLNTTDADISNGAVILNAFGIDEYTEQPTDKDVVFSDDLSTASSMGEWSVADANSDNTTWALVDGIDGITYDSDRSGAKSPADDWLFSPAFDVEGGNDYLVTFTVKRQGAFDPDVLEVRSGSDATPDAMTTVLGTETIDANAETVMRTLRMSCDQTGSTRLALHLTTPSTENGQLSLLSVNVKKTEKTTPEKVANFKAVSSAKDKTVTLTWTNPVLDTKGIGINDPVSVRLLENDEPITTLDNLKAGASQTYTYSPTTFAGYATYKAVAIIGQNESEAVSVTINLDDVQGDTLTARTFNVESADGWEITGDNNAWKYDYRDVFTYDYRKGSKENSEWLLSPTAQLVADRRYVVMYELKTSQDYGNSLQVTIGKEQNPSAQTRVIAAYYNLKQNGFDTYASEQFTIDEDAEYSIGFHVTDNNYYVNMRNLRICYINDGSFVDAITGMPVGTETAKVEVFDTMGRKLAQTSGCSSEATLSAVNHGVYIVRTTDTDGNTRTFKVTK